MKFQIYFVVAFTVAASFAFECQDDVPYIENGCNSCNCYKKQLACTLMACIGDIFTKLENCEVGSTWKYKCNDCWCDKSIKTICTNYPC
ncbi:hypothetical protein FQR65_LT06800 [Abscondita terminalis]|nr:hypothetical protein FQR65_LT06800 [Abscondita terminalis]